MCIERDKKRHIEGQSLHFWPPLIYCNRRDLLLLKRYSYLNSAVFDPGIEELSYISSCACFY